MLKTVTEENVFTLDEKTFYYFFNLWWKGLVNGYCTHQIRLSV